MNIIDDRHFNFQFIMGIRNITIVVRKENYHNHIDNNFLLHMLDAQCAIKPDFLR